MKENIIKRLRNKAFWIALVSGLVILVQQLGLNIFPRNVVEIVNSVLAILTIMGVIVDPTTPGITDKSE